MRIREYDYKQGTFTYGQRIGVGELLRNDDMTEYERLAACWQELYGWKAKRMPRKMRVARLNRMLDGIKYWVDLEAQTLKYDPTPEQERAGIKNMFAQVGHMGTVKALAEKFGKDPDVVLMWEWCKVYGILHADLKEYEYEQRYTKIMANKRH